jgi:hypothetical protein
VIAGGSLAQTIRSETVAQAAAATGTVIEGELRGDDTVDYLVAGEAGQTLSVDLAATNASLYFNILREGSDEALFIGSTSGNVADLTLPATGTYIVRVYLMRNAARRDEAAAYALGIGLGGADFADSLAGGPDWWAVSITPGSALNIRSGPSTRHAVVGKAQNGEVMQNRGCRMTGPDRWCSIRVAGSGVQGVGGRAIPGRDGRTGSARNDRGRPRRRGSGRRRDRLRRLRDRDRPADAALPLRRRPRRARQRRGLDRARRRGRTPDPVRGRRPGRDKPGRHIDL